MEAFTFDDFIDAANGRNTKSASLEKFFKGPEINVPLIDPTKQPAAGGVKELCSYGVKAVFGGKSFKINFIPAC